MKFKVGDIIKCNGKHFAEREITDIDHERNEYVTCFLEDLSHANTNIKVIDMNYWLK